MNRIIKEEESTGKETVDNESRNFTETVKRFADFDFRIKPEQVLTQLPFLAYIFVLIMLFIYNSHRSEKIIREADRLQQEVKDLRSEYISELSLLMGESKQSTVAKKLAPFGIKELKTPPSKITYRHEQ
jgi:cell division protein FtsL